MDALTAPLDDDTWVGLSDRPLPVDEAGAWVVRPDCGAVVVFSGTARDHSPESARVDRLDYEAYEEHVVPALTAVAQQARARWPELGRLVLLHRVGELAIGDSAVVVAASAPHRAEAFEAARFCIDTLKQTAPIWKREAFAGGAAWGRSEA
jgi:molybdopterin synthase catalytic subunit